MYTYYFSYYNYVNTAYMYVVDSTCRPNCHKSHIFYPKSFLKLVSIDLSVFACHLLELSGRPLQPLLHRRLVLRPQDPLLVLEERGELLGLVTDPEQGQDVVGAVLATGGTVAASARIPAEDVILALEALEGLDTAENEEG